MSTTNVRNLNTLVYESKNNRNCTHRLIKIRGTLTDTDTNCLIRITHFWCSKRLRNIVLRKLRIFWKWSSIHPKIFFTTVHLAVPRESRWWPHILVAMLQRQQLWRCHTALNTCVSHSCRIFRWPETRIEIGFVIQANYWSKFTFVFVFFYSFYARYSFFRWFFFH